MNAQNFKRVIGITALTLAVLFGAGFYGISTITADETGSYPPIVQNLADKFELNPDEVDAVFQEQHQLRQQERQNRYQEYLDEAVANGEISEEQKQAILEKQAEMEQQRTQHQEEMRAWAEENGLEDFGMGFRGGFGKGSSMRGMGDCMRGSAN